MNIVQALRSLLQSSYPDVSPSLRLVNKLVYWREQLRGSPLPPTTMMHLVQGNHDADYFVTGGRKAFETLTETLEKSYLSIRQFAVVLDFGCGCGRVLRHWKKRASQIQLHGTDYNPELVYWARRIVPFATIAENTLAPPLPYADNTFDLIYAFSTFTHWDIALQKAWMREFRRILQPNGYLLFTTHGDYYFPRLSPELQEQLRNNQAIGPSLGATIVGTNSYASFNPYTQVRTELLQGLELIEFFRRASRGTPWQDVYVVRKASRIVQDGDTQ